MTEKTVYTLDIQSIRKLASDHERLRQQVYNILHLVKQGKEGETTEIFFGVTGTNAKFPVYPESPANTFVVNLYDHQFTETPGDRQWQRKKNPKSLIGHTIDGSYLSPGTDVVVVRLEGRKNGRRFGILTFSGEGMVRFKLVERLERCHHAEARIVVPSGKEGSEAGSGDEESISESTGESTSEGNKNRWCKTTETITVYDSIGIVAIAFPGKDAAPAGTFGFARRFDDSGKYEVIALGKGCCEETSSSSSSGSNSESRSTSSHSSYSSHSHSSHSHSESRSESHSTSSNQNCVRIPTFSFDETNCDIVECYRLLCFPKGLRISMGDVQCHGDGSNSSSSSESES